MCSAIYGMGVWSPPFCTFVSTIPLLFPHTRLFLGHNFDLSLFSTSLQLVIFSLVVCWREQPKWHHVISVLQTAEPQKYYHVTRIFEPQTKTNGP